MRSLVILVLGATGFLFALASDCPAADPVQAGLTTYIHQAVMARMPRKFEDLSEWGATIPVPAVVRFPRLKRTTVKVGDHFELPHGTWKRTTVWLEDPARDLRIRVAEVRKIGKETTRLHVEATASVRAERERKQWARGIPVLGVTAEADAIVTVGLDIDLIFAFDLTKPLKGVKFAARVAQVRIDLKAFDLRRVGPVAFQEHSLLGDELKVKIQQHLKTLEPKVKDYANRAIGEDNLGDKGRLSAVGDR